MSSREETLLSGCKHFTETENGDNCMRTSKKMNNRYYLKLILIYVVAHVLLCLISGQWWDDWGYWIGGARSLKTAYLESGIPLQAYNIISVMWIPNWGYRIVVFFFFLIIGLLFFSIIRGLNFIPDDDAFWMSAVAMTVPINDARTVLNCYGYSLALFLFMIGFFVAIKAGKCYGWKKVLLRVSSLAFLLYSYTTESLLVLTGLIWLYFLYDIWKKNTDKSVFQNIKVFLKSYGDYFFFPFIFFIFKRIFFKPYGRYTGYNNVTIKSLIKGILFSPYAALKTGASIVCSYIQQISLPSMIVVVGIVIIYLVALWKRRDVVFGTESTIKKRVIILVLGFLVYYAGIFAYIIIRGGAALNTTGVGGRDAMLAGFGIGIIVVAFSRLLPMKRSIQNLIPVILVVLGIFHFNDWYLNYQEDWFYQQELSNAISENDELGKDNTILCDFLTESPIGGTRFYSINGLSYSITGSMDKFYFSGFEDLCYGVNFNEYFTKGGYNCDEYDSSDTTIDGVLVINNLPIDNLELLKIRFNEMFSPKKYDEAISAHTNYQYVKIDKETSDRIYEEYNERTITSERLRQIVGVQ